MGALPSLQTLRALEAAARLQSYSKAGLELGLTHGAISHRIRELELRVGVRLFERDGNTMRPTLRGQQLAIQVRQALSLLEHAFDAKAPSSGGRVVVTCAMALAMTWLAPRLAAFRRESPGIEVELRITDALLDYRAERVDLGLRVGRGDWPGMAAESLFEEVLFPVCTAEYARQHALHAPADLVRANLLRNPWFRWPLWFAAAGLDWPEPDRGDTFDDSSLLLQAAERGEGVALARGWLARDALVAGRLVKPFDVHVPDEFSYFVAWPSGKRLPAPAVRLRDWLVARARAEASEAESAGSG